MDKDYFQDIIPPEVDAQPVRETTARYTPPVAHEPNNREDPSAPRTIPIRQNSDGDQGTPPRTDVPQQRSIRNITNDHPRPTFDRTPLPRLRRPRARAPLFWVMGVILVCAIVAFGGYLYESSKPSIVSVVPRSQTVSFSGAALTAYPASSTSAATGTLAYTVLTQDFSDSTDIPATSTVHAGATTADTKATGVITVYNSASRTISLVTNTRFETGSLIFRTTEKVIVPAAQGSTKGSVSVHVQADKPGSQYNIGPVSHFSVPGLANTSLSTMVYGASSQSMSGGSTGSGGGTGVSADAQSSAQQSVRNSLTLKIQTFIANLAASNQSLVPGALSITYSDTIEQEPASSSVRLVEMAHVVAPVFQTQSLAQAIAQSGGIDTQAQQVSIVFGSLQGQVASSTIDGVSPVSIFLDGTATVAWIVDPTLVARHLAGVASVGQSFSSAIAAMPAIQNAHATIEPFWSHTFPSDPAKINVIVLPTTSVATSSHA